MYINYKRDINFIDPLESACNLVIITKLVCKEVLDAEKVSRIISRCKYEFELNYKVAKDQLSRGSSELSKDIYKMIEDLSNNKSTRIWLKSCVRRFSEWYLYSDKELQNIKTKPFMLDQQYHIFDITISNSSMDMYEIIELNLDRIIKFMPDRESTIRNTIDNLPRLLSEADKSFKDHIKGPLRSFELLLQDQDRSGESTSPVTNKSKAMFYSFPGNNTYIENIFRYNTDMKYGRYLDTSSSYIILNDNFDYMNVNEIKNKGMKTRHVFDTNSQINSFLNKQNSLYKRAFKKALKSAGTYDQNDAVVKAMEFWEKITDGVALCLDVSKYSDTMVVQLLKHILEIIYDKREIAGAISECFNLPILYDGSIHKHVASSQGIYFNFAMITLANIWMQHFISIVSGESLSYCNATGDDVISIFENCTKTKEEMASIGRVCYAIFNMSVNEDKALCSDKLNGEITYLKCHYQMINGESINVSGISPTLYLKSLTSYNSANNTISYLKKSRYITSDHDKEIEEFISLYCATFKDSIRRAHLFARVEEDKIQELYDNAEELFRRRPFMYGGLKNYNLKVRSGREELISDIKSMREYWTRALDEDETSLGLIQQICSEHGLSVYDTCIGADIRAYLNDGFVDIFVKIDDFLSRSKEYIDGKISLEIDELRDVRSILKNLEDRRFDKYKPGGLTTDRTENCYFEDSFLLDAPSYDDSYRFIPLFPTRFESVTDRSSTHLAIKMYESMKGYFYDTNKGNWMIELDTGEKISLVLHYNFYGYTMIDDVISSAKSNNPLAIEKVNKIYSKMMQDGNLSEQVKKDLATFISGDLLKFCSFLSKIGYAGTKEGLIQNALQKLQKDYTIEVLKKEVSKYVSSKSKAINEKMVERLLEKLTDR